MMLTHRDAQLRPSNDVIDWLLDADPSIRWQVMRDLTDTPLGVVAAERARVASDGWGLRLLDQQRPDGQWGDGVATPFWWSNMYTLVFLRDLGVDPATARVRTAVDLVRDNVTWGPEFGDSPFFEGEVEPCINGRVVALGAYFGGRSDRLVDRLLSKGIQPMATLFHWDLPEALDNRGGWLNRDSAQWFAEYADAVFRRLDDRVKFWATHNEPWVVTDGGYRHGVLAPGH
jgi:hypothetical protein